MKKALYFLLAVILLLLTGCSGARQQNGAQPKYQNYREIPGVTQEEIAAIDQLLIEKPNLLYGMCVSTEAYYLPNGSVGGFATLFCDRMSELFGFSFECYLSNWNDINAKITSQALDFGGDFTITPERLKNFYMTDAIVQRTIKIFTDMNAPSLSVTAKTRNIKCAFLNGSTTYWSVAASWELPFDPVFIESESVVPNLFLTGEIDAFIEEGTLEASYDSFGFITAEEFFPLTYSPVSLTTANPALAPIISVMQKYLQNGGFFELTELYNQGYNDYKKYKLFLQLTYEEKEFIQSHSSNETAIVVACETDNYPSSFYNAKESEFQGIAVDVLGQISDLTGLRFRTGNPVNAKWPEVFEGLENGKYSMVTELMRTNHREGRFLWPQKPYSTDKYAMISRANYPDVDINQVLFSKVGLMEGTAYADIFLEWFPNNTRTVLYPSMEKAFNALEKGEIDLLMASQNLLLHMTNYLEKTGFKTNIVFNYSSGSFFGFNWDEKVLCSIINKAQRLIDTEGITEHWKRRVFDYQNKMLKDTMPYLVTFSAVILGAFCVVALLFMKNKKTNRNLEQLVEKRTGELALQTSTLTTVFESIPDIIFCKDMNLCFTRYNKSFEKQFGVSDVVGKDDESGLGMSYEVAEVFRNADRTVINERKTITIEEVLLAADGTAPIFETIKTPLLQNGHPVGILGISRNITQRKAAEEVLKLTLDNLDTCIYINEIETGEILFINDKMAREFGGGDFSGKVCWKVLQNGFSERCEFCPIPHLLKSGDEYYTWEEHNTVTGKYYKNTDSLIKWHDGRLVHMQHSVDVSDLVKLQRDLEHASKAKGDFLSRMSHEIRTPLNAIIGMNGIASNTNDLVKIHNCHERIDNASKHLLGVINDILDMSKIEADKFELSYSEFSFEKLLMNITNVVNFRADEKHQNLVVHLSESVPSFIVSDEIRLSQVIMNLLTNAVKFTPENGTIVLSVKKVAATNEEVTLRIEVVDNGIGISEEQNRRLFTPFEQADNSTSRRFGGTGLGLVISKRIIELMNGTIWIESELGKGSKFIFTIRARKGSEQNRAKLSHKINKQNIRILAVDDSAETREYFEHIMDAHELPCDTAASGSEALAKIMNCGNKPYNIFFVDWQMPEMDGIELTRRIKQITGGNSVVIMISVAEWHNIEKEALLAGVQQFIPKPLYPSTLINTINECLGAPTEKVSLQDNTEIQRVSFVGHTILIAEDVEVNREIMSAILEETGLMIDFAENGRTAVAMFQENPNKYSLILMDIQMPEMDGYDATRTIRALPIAQAKRIPIIAMTANVFREDIENCLDAGMNDHIGKPIDSNGLFHKLDQYLPRK